ncbi:MAG TPA: DUF4388 domain-containing protein [Polyangiaceae bacterium]|nr:DUF4388 domain-containing protein [Polyangiaceae bacterium]
MREARIIVACSQPWVARLAANALEARALQVTICATVDDALAALQVSVGASVDDAPAALQVSVGASVDDALAARQAPIVALVCDAALPDDGLDRLVRGVRAGAPGGHVPVLCLVPDEPSGGRLAALRAGVDVCLAQPFRVDELVAQIEALLAFVARTRPQAAPASSASPNPPASASSEASRPPASASAGASSSPASAAAETPRPPATLRPPPPSALEGELAHVSLSTILSVLEMERRSGVLSVDDGERQTATLELSFGHAAGGSLGGVRFAPLAVLRQVLAWPAGRFRFEPGEVAEAPTGHRSLGALLLEAMRLADEAAVLHDPSGLDEEGPAPVEAQGPVGRARSAPGFDDAETSSWPLVRASTSSLPPSL